MLKKMRNRGGANTQPCFVPLVTLNSGEHSPFSTMAAIIPSCRERMMSTNAGGQPILRRKVQSPGRCTESQAFDRSANTANISRCCSLHISWIRRTVNVMCVVLRPARKPHWLSAGVSHVPLRSSSVCWRSPVQGSCRGWTTVQCVNTHTHTHTHTCSVHHFELSNPLILSLASSVAWDVIFTPVIPLPCPPLSQVCTNLLNGRWTVDPGFIRWSPIQTADFAGPIYQPVQCWQRSNFTDDVFRWHTWLPASEWTAKIRQKLKSWGKIPSSHCHPVVSVTRDRKIQYHEAD